MRRPYGSRSLDEADLAADPFDQFRRWLADAVFAAVPEANAMTLATADGDGAPSARTVLLKGVDDGFCFFTNVESRKGRDLAANPRAALVFWWQPLERQVTVTGAVVRLADETAAAYFASRPPGSRLGAWASRQSEVIPDRRWLEERRREVEARFSGEEPPLPPHWGGYRVVPGTVEFWQGRADRMHDRLRYRRDGDRWIVERLSP